MVNRWLLLGLLALAQGCATTGREEKPVLLEDPIALTNAAPRFSTVGDRIRVCSYNIQDLTDGAGDGFLRTKTVVDRHLQSAARIINAIQPDVLVIQEIENLAVLDRLNQLLEPPFPTGYISSFGMGGRPDKRNIALLSRFEILKIRELDFAGVEADVNVTRGALSGVINLGNNHLLLVYGVHLKSNLGEPAVNVSKRQEALKVIRAHAELVMESNPSKLWEIVVAGDMNVDPELESFADDESLAPLGDWVDLWRGFPLESRTTIPTRLGDPDLEFPAACFDRIIVAPELTNPPWVAGEPVALQRGVDVGNVFTAAGQNDEHVSDHYPVFVDLQR